MITFLRRLLWEPPPREDDRLKAARVELRKRSLELVSLKEAIDNIREASEEKIEVLREAASASIETLRPPGPATEEDHDGRGLEEANTEEEKRSSLG